MSLMSTKFITFRWKWKKILLIRPHPTGIFDAWLSHFYDACTTCAQS